MRLDDAVVAANFEAVRQHYFTLRAMEGRLARNRLARATITFHPDLQGLGDPCSSRP